MESGILFIRMRVLIQTNIEMELRGFIQSLFHVLYLSVYSRYSDVFWDFILWKQWNENPDHIQ